ncbi:unnamed protein product, partial [Ectocarpus sp. 12 AP-2014]
GPDSTRILDAVDEEGEYESEIASAAAGSSASAREREEGKAPGSGSSTEVSPGYHGDAAKTRGGGARGEKESEAAALSSSICARLELDDWRINLIEEPSKASSKVVVLRASLMALFTRSVTSGEGGDSTEDTLHLSLLKTE